jgi:hypothetical protein
LYAKRFLNFLHKVFPEQPWNWKELLLFINYHRSFGKGFPFLFCCSSFHVHVHVLFLVLASLQNSSVQSLILFVK